MMLTGRLFVANGGGIDEEFNCEKDVDICIGTLSKAAGCHERFSFAYGNHLLQAGFHVNVIKPPTVRFVSRTFHGSICWDILQKNQWSPVYDVAAIFTSIQSLMWLLEHPNWKINRN